MKATLNYRSLPMVAGSLCIAFVWQCGTAVASGRHVSHAARQENATREKRLTPLDIKELPFLEAGVGTSGVSGIQTRILKGDPKKAGLYTIQLVVPAHTQIQAHAHPDDRIATVISGEWSLGYGSHFDSSKLKRLPPGSFYTEPPEEPHFAQTGATPAIVQITGMGPSATTYVKPSGDRS